MREIYKGKITGNSPRVTQGDPKNLSNRDSDKEVNTINKAFIPKNK